jgi:diaminopimelate epimerase
MTDANKMGKILQFTKLVASGNDFLLIDARGRTGLSLRGMPSLARLMCNRTAGAGADGLLVFRKSARADARMNIFNSDGSEAEMCGNGARCFALFLSLHSRKKTGRLRIETAAGIVEAIIGKDTISVKLTDPGAPVFDMPVDVLGRSLRVNCINTGVPHAVIFVEGLGAIDVDGLGRAIRYHQKFAPAGTNVDFIEITGPDAIAIRTYERGVEGETLACGTGSCAAALIANAAYGIGRGLVKVATAGGEILNVRFTRKQGGYTDLWLEGKARIVYEGRSYPAS